MDNKTIKIVWESSNGGKAIVCTLYENLANGAWLYIGGLGMSADAFTAFTYCLQGKGTFILEGKKHADKNSQPIALMVDPDLTMLSRDQGTPTEPDTMDPDKA